MKTNLVTLSLSVLIAACTVQTPTLISSQVPVSTATNNPVRHTASSPPPTSTPTRLPVPAIGEQQVTITPESQSVNRAHYDLDATLNYTQHHLSVDEKITYINQSAEAHSDLLLIVEPARYPGVFQLQDLTWKDGRPILDYNRDLGIIRIPLATPLPPGEQIGIFLSYELNLPSPDPSYYGRPVPFGYSSRQTNLVDWYPFIPPYMPDKGWLAHRAGAFGEHLVYDIADFDVHIKLSDSNPDLVIAASAPAEITDNVYHYQFDSARNFSWSVSDQYVLSTKTVNSVAIMSYYFPLNAQAGEAVLQTTAESLGLYNNLFGPYPRKTLTVIEADFLDGMEYDGLYFLSKGFYNLYSGDPADYLTSIAAHETAHQWWYAALGNDQAFEPWLDEALCTYSERLYYENLQPESLDWWWTYRIFYYEPRGWVDGSIYNPQGYRAYRDAVYLNGALFLEDLRNTIGDEPFFEFIHAYSQENYRKIVTGDDFFAILANFSQIDLTPLVAKYFQNR